MIQIIILEYSIHKHFPTYNEINYEIVSSLFFLFCSTLRNLVVIMNDDVGRVLNLALNKVILMKEYLIEAWLHMCLLI